MKKIKLFCLPYAGGSAEMIYKKWRPHLYDSIELIPVELAGRGRRFGDKGYNKFEDAVEDAYDFIIANAGESEYSLYGHSMGALLAFELSHKLKEGKKKPRHLFISGRRSPNVKSEKDEDLLHRLSDESFKKRILDLNGTSKEVFENEALVQLFLPVLRNDYKIIENYKYKNKQDKLDIELTVLNGKNDDLTEAEINGWEELTDSRCEKHLFDGDHFFINENFDKISKIINSKLN